MSDDAEPTANKIAILIADDYPVIRRGVANVLAGHPEMDIVAQAGDAETVLTEIERTYPQVVVLDLGMPGVRGLELVRSLRERYPTLGIVVYTMYPEEDLAVPCLKAGANGFLHKTASEAELVRAVRDAAEGLRYLSAALAERIVAEMKEPEDEPPHRALTQRELHVLCLLAEGKRPAEIGRSLGISYKTVYTYRVRILEKLGVRSTVELVLYAAEHHLLGWRPPNARERAED